MDIDYDKLRDLLERVTTGGAGEVYINFSHDSETCTITWKRPKGLIDHISWSSRVEMFLYVKDLLVDAGVGVSASTVVTQEDFLPED